MQLKKDKSEEKPRKWLKATTYLLLSFTVMGCWSMPFSKASFKNSTSTLNLFSYSEDNIPDIGTVYHYNKSNRNGSYIAEEWIYIESNTHTESFKIYPFARNQKFTDLVVADYDLSKFYAKSINAYLVSTTGERKLNVSTTSSNGETYTVLFGNDKYDLKVGHSPSFNYNFDWCDFAFMYRHLIKKDQNFTIGVTVPNSFIKLIYAGKADFKYMGIIEYKNIISIKYEISGEAFGTEKGYLYTDLSTGALVEIDMPVRNNGNYDSFKFTIIDKQQMTKLEWDDFILKQTREAL